MFDFNVSFVADELNDDTENPAVDVLAPVDWSVDALMFETIPVNRIDLP